AFAPMPMSRLSLADSTGSRVYGWTRNVMRHMWGKKLRHMCRLLIVMHQKQDDSMATVREHYDTSAKALNAQRHWDLGSKVDSVIVRVWGKVSHCLEENAKYWSFYFPERAEIGCIYYLLSQPHVSDGVISHDEPEQEIGFAHTPERQTLSSF